MKLLIHAAILCLCASCTIRPTVTATTPEGTKLRMTLGGTLMSEADEVVAEVQAPGPYKLRYAAKREDSTRVPIAFGQAWVARALGLAGARSTDLKTTTDGAILLKGTKDPNIIPKDPNLIPVDPNIALPLRQ